MSFPDAMVSDEVEVTVSVRGVLDASASTGRRAFRPARTPRFDFVAPVLGAPVHTLVGDEDRYDLTTTAVLPPRVTGLVYDLGPRAHFREAAVGTACTVLLDGRRLRCPGLRDGDRVRLHMGANGLTTSHRFGLRVSPVHRFVDPVPENNTAAITLRPGADLGLSLEVASEDPVRTGLLTLSGRLTGGRAGLGAVAYTLSSGATFLAGDSDTGPGCTLGGQTLVCPVPAEGDVTLTVASASPEKETPVTVSVTPAAPFEPVGGDRAEVELKLPGRPVHDFSLSSVEVSEHTLVDGGDRDRYTVTARIGALPVTVRSVAFTLEGGARFATDQGDDGNRCTLDPATAQVRCTQVASEGQVALVVESTLPDPPRSQQATLTLLPAAPFEDTDQADDRASTLLVPGVDLRLAALTPDDGSPGPPANVDDSHVVATTLSGVRPGQGSVTYALTGTPPPDATLGGVQGATCTGKGTTTLTCRSPSNGPVRLVVVTKQSASRDGTPVTVTVSAPEPFVQLEPADNTRSTTLAARPSYNFGLGPLRLAGHTVSGDTDLLTLTGTVRAPDDIGPLTFGLDGQGTFTEQQATGCRRVDTAHVMCDPGTSGAVELRVASTSHAAHTLTLSVLPPAGFRDPSLQDNDSTLRVTPGVDLQLGPLTPADPVPSGGAYRVSSVLTGVRSGPVRFELTGQARFTSTSCTLTSGTEVTCEAPTSGQQVDFTLEPTTAAASTDVTIGAHAGDFEELVPEGNEASTTLAPDVTISALDQRPGSNPLFAVVRVQVRGVPAGVSTVRLHLTGADVGPTGLRFTTGAAGADGEGSVTCFTSDASGRARADDVYVTCTGTARTSSFYVDTRVARMPLRSSVVVVTVIPVGADEGAHAANDSRGITLHLVLKAPESSGDSAR